MEEEKMKEIAIFRLAVIHDFVAGEMSAHQRKARKADGDECGQLSWQPVAERSRSSMHGLAAMHKDESEIPG